ncbi:hypothetical protein CWI36_0035p0090 [Hamiltosporidium magnivora]|uniref:Uncharacterized protein n=1 Tax=Hamiltosporidium magnivora TaxID=148818 RepID=A0A4Q9LN47_9MICR|nr:hypothetical protein CWI36_0035p0090 [Hamiltosporidium magnivora]
MGSIKVIMKLFRIYLFAVYLFVELSVGKMDLTKKEKYFSRKCHSLYTIETMKFEYLPKAIDFTYFILYPTISIHAFESISSYLQSGISTKYELVFYHPYRNYVGNSFEIIFQNFELNRINNEFWSFSKYNKSGFLNMEIRREKYKIFRKEFLKYFLKLFFSIFKVVNRLFTYSNLNGIEFPNITINDITNGISKEIPAYYQKIPNFSIFNQNSYVCLKIFSENVDLNTRIDREKIVEQFNLLFNEFPSKVCFGMYINFLTNMSQSEIHKAPDTTMESCKTIINDYRIIFSDSHILENIEGKISVAKRLFNFEKSDYTFKYEHFFTSNKLQRSDYKFYILFQRNTKIFEFNYKWYNSCDFNQQNNYSSFYIAVYISFDIYLIEFKEYKNQRYFHITKVESSNHRIKYFDNDKLYYKRNEVEISRFLDKIIFYQRDEYLI